VRLHDFLDYRAREQPAAVFAEQGERSLTYAEAMVETNRLANAFLASGLVAGDRVAVLAKNSIEYVLLYFAASKAGVVPVPLNYRLAPPEWAYIVNDARARMLLAGGEFLPALAEIRGKLETVEHWVALDGDGDGWEVFAGWRAGRADSPPETVVSEEDVVFQMYTSGTTGHPKGVLLTHRTVTVNQAQSVLVLPGTPGERWLVVAPIFHIAATFTVFNGVYWGTTLHIQGDFIPQEVVRALSEEGIAYATLVPAMLQACLVMAPDVAERRYPQLRLIGYGASAISEATLQRAAAVFGCDFIQAYGMTETSPILTILTPADHRRALAERPDLLLSAGRAVPGTDLRVVDENDNPLPPGAIGEIVARGPQLMKGYWNQPEATAEALRGGWMHTGDAGVLDAEGYLYVQDRVKDMIVSGGENIYPREVEDVLFQHPAVADVAVIGVPDEHWGEAVKALVVLRPGTSATAQELIDFCLGKLGRYKRPRSVDFVTVLPRNPSGKVLKRVLREPYWAGRARKIGAS
jgi:acyl-CoA synthetase (AMP-forming)/AMP-acid ligase II